MESDQKLTEQLVKNSRAQLVYARIQCFFTIAAAVFCLLLLISVCRVIPQIQELAAQVSGISSQAETVLSNLEIVTEELAQADISGMVANVDTLVSSSQDGVRQALEKINAIDIDTLNKAIDDLSKVVSPLANLINRFN